MGEPVSYTNRTILAAKPMEELCDEYIAVSSRLHGDGFTVTLAEFKRLLSDPKELVTFVLIDEQLVATAQASLLWTPPKLQAYINNVVTHPDFGGRGLGTIAMTTLESAIQSEWGDNGDKTVYLLLSNSPSKNNGGFYEKLGWTSRGHDSDNPTILWVKTI